MIAISLLGLVLLAVTFTSGAVTSSAAVGSSRFEAIVRRGARWLPLFALALVWAIVLGTRSATGTWPEASNIILKQGGEVVFVGNPPDGYWELLKLFAQLTLAATIGLMLGLPVAYLRRRLTLAPDRISFEWQRIVETVLCTAAIVASYYTIPGQSALDWIID